MVTSCGLIVTDDPHEVLPLPMDGSHHNHTHVGDNGSETPHIEGLLLQVQRSWCEGW